MSDAGDPSQDHPVQDPPALEIPTDVHAAMIAHCVRESPLEACGLLGGVAPRVLSIHPLTNIAASETRYLADPAEQLHADRWLREHGEKVVAIYHSHPRWEPIPSATDLKENYLWGLTPRIIVSLLRETPVVRVWQLDANSYQELPWRLVQSNSAIAAPLQGEPPRV
jgi:proteasome lid subunit RPN8/RPN11